MTQPLSPSHAYAATLAAASALGNNIEAGIAPTSNDIILVQTLVAAQDERLALATNYLFTAVWAGPSEAGFALLETAGLRSSIPLGFSSSTLAYCHANHLPRLAAWMIAHKPDPLDDTDDLLFAAFVGHDDATIDAWHAGDVDALTKALQATRDA